MRDLRADAHPFTLADVDLQEANLQLYYRDPAGARFGRFDVLRNCLAKSNRKLLFATNAGIFNPDFTPCGLHVENGVVIAPLNQREGAGNFYMKPNGVFMIDDSGARIIDARAYSFPPGNVHLAMQSGPLLVIDGQLNPQFAADSTSKRIRSGVGVVTPHRVVFLISREPVTFYEFAVVFRDTLECAQALYLDGEISAFYPTTGSSPQAAHEYVGILGVTPKR